jgi:hypothetical protein
LRVHSSGDCLTTEKPNRYGAYNGGKTTTYKHEKYTILVRGVKRWAPKLGSPSKKGISGAVVALVGIASKVNHPLEVMICDFFEGEEQEIRS